MNLKEDTVNLGRQRELDLVKALAIFFMIIIHVYEEMSVIDSTVLCTKPLDVILQFLGGPLAAPVFMFSLGLGLSYSSHRSPELLIKRGIKLFLLSYLFNIVRFSIPYLLAVGWSTETAQFALYLTLHIDILPFAGLSFILTGLLKKWNISVYGVVFIAVLLQGTGLVITSLCEFDTLVGVFLGGLFIKTGIPSYFPLFQWYIYPALGLLFAKYLRHIEDTDKLYKTMFAVSAAVLFSFCATMHAIGFDIRNLFTLADELYYDQNFLHTCFILACIGLELSAVHFVLKLVHLPRVDKVIGFMSSKLNTIYIIQWLIIGWLGELILNETSYCTTTTVVPVGILLTAVSVALAWVYCKLVKKGKKAPAKA